MTPVSLCFGETVLLDYYNVGYVTRSSNPAIEIVRNTRCGLLLMLNIFHVREAVA